jgi:esterase/lipase superfamily enzyme
MPVDRSIALADIKAQGKPVVLFIHGFNESWQRDMDVMQAVFDGLGPDVTLVGYSWPSQGNILEYLEDRVQAERSATDLLQCLRDLECPNVIAHSMGNFLLQKALESAGTAPCVDKLVMVAADVPFDALNTSNIAEMSNKVLVMYCPADGALLGSGIIHLGARLGLVGAGHAPENCQSVNCIGLLPAELNPVDLHGDYFRSGACWEVVCGFLAKKQAASA